MGAAEGGLPGWTDRRGGSGRPGGHRILVSDEDASILRLLVAILGDRGHEVRASSDPADVLPALAGGEVSLAILGLRAAGGPDLRAVRDLRERGCGVPVLVMSGAFPEEALKAAAAVPGLALLGKPFSLPELDEAVRRLSGGPEGPGPKGSPNPGPASPATRLFRARDRGLRTEDA